MISIRKFAPIALAIGMAFAGTAQAAVDTNFNLKDGQGNTIVANATTLDWSSAGSGVAVGIGPFGTPLRVGDTFDFRYQANLVAVNGGTPTSLIRDLDTTSNGVEESFYDYEFTIAAKLREVVRGVDTVGGFPTATFGLSGGMFDNKVAIYYDTNHNADTVAGTGFDDGILIAMLTVVGNGTTSNFSVTGANAGQGSAKLSAEVLETGVDFINAAYLENVERLLFGLDFESTLNYPAGAGETSNFHIGGSDVFGNYQVGANDIVFKVDGSNTFNQVPEPGSMVLLGAGLLGFLGAARRRKAKKA
jgi:hypothetical protein